MHSLVTSKLLLICLFYTLCLSQDPKVRITETVPETSANNKIVIDRDSDLVMNCYVENLYQSLNVRWQREYIDPMNGLAKTQSISQDMALDDNIHYSIEKPSEYTWSLRVRGTQVTDEGKYICFVQLTQISRSQDFRTVQVVVKPFLEPQYVSPDTSADEGENLKLMCNATGIPPPNVIWSRLGGQLLSIGQEKFEGAILPLNSIQASDRGTYRCTAMNDYGTTTHDIEVTVRFKPIIVVGRSVVEQAVGYRAELQCFIEANPNPKSEISAWVKGTTTYTISSDRYIVNWVEGAFNRMTYELIIKDVRPEDYGVFTCRVSNDEVKKGFTTATITLKQTDTPQPSIKLGRVIRASENPEGSASATPRGILLLSIISMLISVLLTC